MSTYSYQDLEARIRVLEDKLNFVMLTVQIQTVDGIIDKKVVSKPLLQLYLEAKGMSHAWEALKAKFQARSTAENA